ncbi:MAG: hypothetical protein MUC38_02760 [Cyclobacteriaceae bacterium]|nr:hypothetical protein [Cyclobacteriaceae bacterium]
MFQLITANFLAVAEIADVLPFRKAIRLKKFDRAVSFKLPTALAVAQSLHLEESIHLKDQGCEAFESIGNPLHPSFCLCPASCPLRATCLGKAGQHPGAVASRQVHDHAGHRLQRQKDAEVHAAVAHRSTQGSRPHNGATVAPPFFYA